MSTSVSYLLVFHGSFDPRPAAAAKLLAEVFYQRIRHCNLPAIKGSPAIAQLSTPEANPSSAITIEPSNPLVEAAYLECGPMTLAEQIVQFSQQQALMVTTAERHCLKILPLFLLPGVHVMDDIPHEVNLAQQALGEAIQIEICPHLGAHLRLRRVLTERLSPLAVEAWILLAHGSRRSGANQPIAALAEHLGAIAAYWATPPSLEDRLRELAQAGFRQIGVFPYFLFEGGITDAITQRVALLSQEFPAIHLHLAKPLEANAELTDLLVDFATQS